MLAGGSGRQLQLDFVQRSLVLLQLHTARHDEPPAVFRGQRLNEYLDNVSLSIDVHRLFQPPMGFQPQQLHGSQDHAGRYSDRFPLQRRHRNFLNDHVALGRAGLRNNLSGGGAR